jgi:hypothetical protein
LIETESEALFHGREDFRVGVGASLRQAGAPQVLGVFRKVFRTSEDSKCVADGSDAQRGENIRPLPKGFSDQATASS